MQPTTEPHARPVPVPTVPAIAEGAEVVHLPLETILGGDTTFMFRLQLRVSPLKVNLQHEGQQLPVVVRPIQSDGAPRYQLISGFRRFTAIRELGWPTIAAIVRKDLADDEAAFRASVVENVARRSYSDIDRALVIRTYKDKGFTGADIARALGMDNRTRKLLASLLQMPESVQTAIDDPDHPFTTKHAVLLWRLHNKHPNLRLGDWVERVRTDNLSADTMARRIKTALTKDRPERRTFQTLFQARGTSLPDGKVWFAPTRVDLKALSDDERGRLKAELEGLLRVIGE